LASAIILLSIKTEAALAATWDRGLGGTSIVLSLGDVTCLSPIPYVALDKSFENDPKPGNFTGL